MDKVDAAGILGSGMTPEPAIDANSDTGVVAPGQEPQEPMEQEDDLEGLLWPDGRPSYSPEPAVAPKHDPNRYEYWQSQAQKMQAELERLKQESPIAPSEPPTTPVTDSENRPTRPTPPARPATFNEADALTDPQSESFKYRIALEGYRDEMVSYLEKKEEVRESQQIAEQERQKMEQEYRSRIGALKVSLKTQHGLTSDQIEDFMRTFSDPSSFSVESFVELYKIKKGLTRNPSDPTARVRPQKVPLPAAVFPGQGEPTYSEEDLLNMDILSKGKARSRR